ncbi:MAG: glycosyltransferase family 39 protein [bacterium]|nr:glycosyltransferase family 39 protein [bacterium]
MTNKIIKFAKDNWIFLSILIIGILFRTYKPIQSYMYTHDQDLAGWIVKDILVNKHLRLIGQETSSQGVFIGPLFYYLQIPFYLLTKMDPSGTIFLVTMLGVLTIFSFFFCFSKMFGKKVGFIASFIYAVTMYYVNTDREIVPTMPVYLWSVWFFYGTWLILKGKSRAYVFLGFLSGFIWNFNLALATVVPLVAVAQILSKTKINFKHIFLGIVVFVVTMSPYFVFEARHSSRLTKAIISSLITPKDFTVGTGRGLAKLDRVFQLVHKNVDSIVWGPIRPLPKHWTLYLLIIIFVFLYKRRIVPKDICLIMFLWLLAYIAFFTVNSIDVSEYYLNGMNIVWILIISLWINYLLKNKNSVKRETAILILVMIGVLGLYGLLTKSINRSGYLDRKAVVKFIKEDSQKQGYPCVSVSYITSPGNDLGYRYFYWLEKMHVNKPISNSPVYSIVFPHSMVDRIDKSFGALGLVLPDYAKYNKEDVDKSCLGENKNLTEPMFGYTQ